MLQVIAELHSCCVQPLQDLTLNDSAVFEVCKKGSGSKACIKATIFR